MHRRKYKTCAEHTCVENWCDAEVTEWNQKGWYQISWPYQRFDVKKFANWVTTLDEAEFVLNSEGRLPYKQHLLQSDELVGTGTLHMLRSMQPSVYEIWTAADRHIYITLNKTLLYSTHIGYNYERASCAHIHNNIQTHITPNRTIWCGADPCVLK